MLVGGIKIQDLPLNSLQMQNMAFMVVNLPLIGLTSSSVSKFCVIDDRNPNPGLAST